MEKIRLLMLGDIVGAPGRAILQKHISHVRDTYAIDAVIVNGENSASDGRGITSRIVKFFKHNGVDIVTSGNHIWQKREIYSYLTDHRDLLRPLNFPSACPGVGVTTFVKNGVTIGVINAQGRVFMRELVSCPFRAVESAITFLKPKTHIIVVDMHGEATSEKLGLAWYFDGQLSAVVGTHTHVQTADERILPQGTAYISDLGMAGTINSMIGMKKEPIIQNMLTQMPIKFEVETQGPVMLSGVWIDIDVTTGKALAIERIRITDEQVRFDGHDLGD
jgi:2',3'-cyclic-nucleotide 2'-phosphodiesterase